MKKEKEKHFYRDFEDTFRGPYEAIKARLAIYQEFVAPLLIHKNPCEALDLGCGRGEWLEILTCMGIRAWGVDQDEGMVCSCRDRGFSVFQGDATAFLRDCPDSSFAVISGFHIAEHLPFAKLQDLIQQVLRVLTSGGLLILETPNPDNIVSASAGFYTDPTHIRPLPDPLLKFLVEYYGFARAKVLRLQERVDLHNADRVRLADVLGGASPDYGLIAQKAADPEFMSQFDKVFAQERGLTTANLSARYDAYHDRRWLETTQKVGLVDTKVQELEAHVDSLKEEIHKLEVHVVSGPAGIAADGQNAQTEHERDETLAKVDMTHGEPQRLDVIKVGRAWSPSFLRSTTRSLKASLRPLVFLVIRKVPRHARMRLVVLRLLGPFPRLKTQLRALTFQQNAASDNAYGDPTGLVMSSGAAKIYARLLAIRASNASRGHN